MSPAGQIMYTLRVLLYAKWLNKHKHQHENMCQWNVSSFSKAVCMHYQKWQIGHFLSAQSF